LLFYINSCTLNQADIRKQIFYYYAGRLTPAEQAQLLETLNLLTTAELEALYPASEWDGLNRDLSAASVQTEAALRRHRELRKGSVLPITVHWGL
jgi:hypothetical protein